MAFRRRSRRQNGEAAEPVDSSRGADAAERVDDTEATSLRAHGPFDASEVDLDEALGHMDFGGLLVPAGEDLTIQLQVDENRRPVGVWVGVDRAAAVQLIPLAAPRSSGLWDQKMLEFAAEANRRGGTVEEAVGPFGTELRLVMPVTTPDGKKTRQPSRVSGIDGPRWMLQATFLGVANSDADMFKRLVQVVRATVVVRGDGPMAPGDVIRLRPPQPS